MSPAEAETVRALLATGASRAEIGAKIGRTKRSVHGWMMRNGLRSLIQKDSPFTPAEDAVLRSLTGGKITANQIASRMGRSYCSIRGRMRRLGLDTAAVNPAKPVRREPRPFTPRRPPVERAGIIPPSTCAPAEPGYGCNNIVGDYVRFGPVIRCDAVLSGPGSAWCADCRSYVYQAGTSLNARAAGVSVSQTVLEDIIELKKAALAADWVHFDIIVDRLKADIDYYQDCGDFDD